MNNNRLLSFVMCLAASVTTNITVKVITGSSLIAFLCGLSVFAILTAIRQLIFEFHNRK